MMLFEDIAQVFLKVTLSFMQYGALPELHGQNILLSFEDGRVQNACYVIMILSEFINHG